MSSNRTIREACLEASSFFAQHHIEDSQYCAELMMRYLLGWSRTDLFLRWQEPLPSPLVERWQAIIRRRVAGEPAQYIIGEQEFYGLPFLVDSNVLIPRPETELLVEQVLLRMPAEQALTVVDVGTGSGAIPISLAVQRHNWQFYAIDFSLPAIEVAKKNAERLQVERRIHFLHGDGLFAIDDSKPLIDRPIDVLISNPPYIPTADILQLQTEVKDYEPQLALDGGADGLDAYRKIIGHMSRLTKFPKFIAFEVGQGQSAALTEMLEQCNSNFTIEVIQDFANIDRIVIASM